MKITHYLFNAFNIKSGNKIIAIDPGALFFYWCRFTSLIPKIEWNRTTHILITHGHSGRYLHVDRLANTSDATVICNRTMIPDVNG